MVEISSTLNAFQSFLVQKEFEAVERVLVLGVRNGAFLRALRDKLGTSAFICAGGGPRSLADSSDRYEPSVWALDAWRQQVEEQGAFDLILLLDTGHWWDGRIDQLAEVREFLSDNGSLWVQYFNALSVDVLRLRLSAGAEGGGNLGMPIHRLAMSDFGSWASFFARVGLRNSGYWALANAAVFNFFKEREPTSIDFAGESVTIKTEADALNLGCFVHAIEAKPVRKGEAPEAPSFNLSPQNGAGMQGFLYPHPVVDERPVERLKAREEIAAVQAGRKRKLNPQWAGLLGLFEESGDVRKVLLTGAGWGGDILLLKHHYPSWEWHGIEADPELIKMGQKAFPELEDAIMEWKPGAELPVNDGSYDLVVSLEGCTYMMPQLVALLIPEMIRVTQRYLAHFEDAAGPERSLLKKQVPLPEIYSKYGVTAKPQPLMHEDKETGYYFLAINLKKPNEGPNGTES